MQNSHQPFSPPSSKNLLIPSPLSRFPLSPPSPASKRLPAYELVGLKKVYLTGAHKGETSDYQSESEKKEKTYLSDSSGNNTEDKGSQTLWTIPLDVALPSEVLSSGSCIDQLERHAHKKFRHRRRELVQRSGDSDTQDEDQQNGIDYQISRNLEKNRDRPYRNPKTNERKREILDRRTFNESRPQQSPFNPCSPDSIGPFSEPRTPYSVEPRTPYSEPRTPYSDPRSPLNEPQTPFSDQQTPYSEPRTPYSEPPRTPYNDPLTPYNEPKTPYSTPSTPASSHSGGPRTPFSVANSPMVQSVEPHTPQSLEAPDSVGSHLNDIDDVKCSEKVNNGSFEPVIDLTMPKYVESSGPKTPYSEPRTPYIEPITPYSVQPGSQVVQIDDTEFDSGYSSKTDVSDYRMSMGNLALIQRETFLAKAKSEDKNTIDLCKNNPQILTRFPQNAKHHAEVRMVASRPHPDSNNANSQWSPRSSCDKSPSDTGRRISYRESAENDNSKRGYESNNSVEFGSKQSSYSLSKEQQFERNNHRNIEHFGSLGSPKNSVKLPLARSYSVEQCDQRNSSLSKSNLVANRDTERRLPLYNRSASESPRTLRDMQHSDNISAYQSLPTQPILDNQRNYIEPQPYQTVRETMSGENVRQSEETHSKHHADERPDRRPGLSQSVEVTPFRPLIIDLDKVSSTNRQSSGTIGQAHSNQNDRANTGCSQNRVNSGRISREPSPCLSVHDGQNYQRQISEPVVISSPQKRDRIPSDFVMRSPPFVAPALKPWGCDPSHCLGGPPGFFGGNFNPLVNNFGDFSSNPAIPRFIHPAMPSMVPPSSQANSVMGRPYSNGHFQNQLPLNSQQLPQEVSSEQYHYINEDILRNIKQEKLDDQDCNQSQCQVSMFHNNSPLIDSDRSLDSCDSSNRAIQRKRISIDSNIDSSPCTKSKRTSYQKEIEKVSCQVCSDVASGFHCGAYVCEACKKFFIRSSKNGSMKYVCSKSQSCLITKESRTQCQHCRYQKCLVIGMLKPGTDPLSSVDADISHIPCKVCGAPSSGFHFGAITCEGCKGFFRRTIKERDSYRYSCSKGGNCSITMATRNACKYCRFRKCLEAGMTPEGSRIGRQPNSVKHATMMELKQLHRTGPALPTHKSRTNSCPSTPLPSSPGKPSTPKPSMIVVKKEIGVLTDEDFDFYETGVRRAVKDLIGIRAKPTNMRKMTDKNPLAMWSVMMEQFNHDALCALRFAKKIPGFRKLPISDQITLVQTSLYQLCIFMHVDLYNAARRKVNYFNFTEDELSLIMTTFPNFQVFADHFVYFGETLQELNMDDMEYGFLSAIQLMSSDEGELKSMEIIDEIQENISLTLQRYIESKEGPDSNRFGFLLLRLPELRLASINHQQVIINLKKEMPDLPFPQLFTEMFLNDIDQDLDKQEQESS